MPLNYDSEIILTLYKTLEEIFEFLRIGKQVEIHLNNKKFIEWICGIYKITWENKIKFFWLLDSYYKVTPEEFWKELKNLVWEKFNEINQIINTKIEDLDSANNFLKEWISELKIVYKSLKDKWVNVIFNPHITRWLDYYTWTVFETFISNFDNFWSICSWWRYDNLVWAIRKVANKWKEVTQNNYEWVWGSIWLSRLFWGLDENWLINNKIPLTEAIIFNTPWSNLEYKEQIWEILRLWWIKTDIYYPDDKIWKQFTYAESKNVIFWIFAWNEEQMKNEVLVRKLYTREQESVLVNDLINYINKKLFSSSNTQSFNKIFRF